MRGWGLGFKVGVLGFTGQGLWHLIFIVPVIEGVVAAEKHVDLV